MNVYGKNIITELEEVNSLIQMEQVEKFVENIETTEIKYFSLDELPENLAIAKTTKAQIEMCFNAYIDPNWQCEFD